MLQLKKQKVKPQYPEIAQVTNGAHRPTWSVMIPVRDRTTYLNEALESVLCQDQGASEMQIAIVDNSTKPINWEQTLNPSILNRIEIHKNREDLYVAENWNRCIELSRGHLIHILHDDDWIAEGFYQAIETAFSQHKQICATFVAVNIATSSGNIIKTTHPCPQLKHGGTDPGTLTDRDNNIYCPGVAIRRTFYETHGGFWSSAQLCPDFEMWMRAIAIGGGISIQKPLAFYRVHDDQFSQGRPYTPAGLKDREETRKRLFEATKIRFFTPEIKTIWSKNAETATMRALAEKKPLALMKCWVFWVRYAGPSEVAKKTISVAFTLITRKLFKLTAR